MVKKSFVTHDHCNGFFGGKCRKCKFFGKIEAPTQIFCWRSTCSNIRPYVSVAFLAVKVSIRPMNLFKLQKKQNELLSNFSPSKKDGTRQKLQVDKVFLFPRFKPPNVSDHVRVVQMITLFIIITVNQSNIVFGDILCPQSAHLYNQCMLLIHENYSRLGVLQQ